MSVYGKRKALHADYVCCPEHCILHPSTQVLSVFSGKADSSDTKWSGQCGDSPTQSTCDIPGVPSYQGQPPYLGR
jgi:hypothetical protein